MSGLCSSIVKEVDPFLLLFLDNVATIVGLSTTLTMPGFGAPAGAAIGAYSAHCGADGYMKPPWPPEQSKCYQAADNIATIVYGRVISGMLVTMIFGNVYYAWMAFRTGRDDMCALPYGVNTPAAFAFIFSIVLPAGMGLLGEDTGKIAGMVAAGNNFTTGDVLPRTPNQLITEAWEIGCLANIIAGVIAMICGLIGPLIMKATPKAALLVALAGIGFTFLGIAQLQVAFNNGLYGFLPLVAMVAIFFGNINTGPVPGALVVILVGAISGWLIGDKWDPFAPEVYESKFKTVEGALSYTGFFYPHFLPVESLKDLPVVLSEYMSVILPVAFTGAAGTLLNVYSAKEAGDEYPLREAMVIDGLTTVVAGLFASPFGTCVYVGHPSYKKRGGKYVYSIMSCVLFSLLAMSGLFAIIQALVPPSAVAPIILFVGLSVNLDAFAATPTRHLPIATLGLFPVVCEYIKKADFGGDFKFLYPLALGSLLTGVIWVSMLVLVTDRRYTGAAMWAVGGAICASCGLIHQKAVFLPFTGESWTRPWKGTSAAALSIGYALLALVLVGLHMIQSSAVGSNYIPKPEPDEDDAAATARSVSICVAEQRQSLLQVPVSGPPMPMLAQPSLNQGTELAYQESFSTGNDNA
jgi:AGZA family xanthine/uracil permease-like MFS transporter